jgi:hypothetical protein
VVPWRRLVPTNGVIAANPAEGAALDLEIDAVLRAAHLPALCAEATHAEHDAFFVDLKPDRSAKTGSLGHRRLSRLLPPDLCSNVRNIHNCIRQYVIFETLDVAPA